MTTSLTKVIYSILESKYGSSGNAKKQKTPTSSGEKKKAKKKRGAKDDSDDEDYDINQDQSYVSDDSRCAQN